MFVGLPNMHVQPIGGWLWYLPGQLFAEGSVSSHRQSEQCFVNTHDVFFDDYVNAIVCFVGKSDSLEKAMMTRQDGRSLLALSTGVLCKRDW
jgi:hypothetical protein